MNKVLFFIPFIFLSLFSFDKLPFREIKVTDSIVWTDLEKTEIDSFRRLIDLLEKSTTARKILSKAYTICGGEKGLLEKCVESGEGSLTDFSLSRKYSQSDPTKMEHVVSKKVILNRNLRIMDAVMDLIHELTHFSLKVPYNPYVDNFTAKTFINETIQGVGGEVDAFSTECKVLRELSPYAFDRHSQCQVLLDDKGRISRAKAIKSFWQVGEYFNKFNEECESMGIDLVFELLTDKDIAFTSAAYDYPYPLAALLEYQMVKEQSCKNDFTRLKIMQRRVDRAPASRTPEFIIFKKQYSGMLDSYTRRCL